jgi:hypothetical protein
MNEDIDQQETDDEDQQETNPEDQQDEQEIEDEIMNVKEGNEEEEDDQEEQEIEKEDQQDFQDFDSIFHECDKMLEELSQSHCEEQNEEEQYEEETEEMGRKVIMNFEMNPEIEDEFMSGEKESFEPEHQQDGEGMEEQPQQKKEEMNGKKLVLNPFFNTKLRTNLDNKDDSVRLMAMFDKMIDDFKCNSKFNDEQRD